MRRWVILQAYRHELRRTVAYVAEKMEDRGEQIDWDYLYVGAIAEDHPKNFLSSLSETNFQFHEATSSVVKKTYPHPYCLLQVRVWKISLRLIFHKRSI